MLNFHTCPIFSRLCSIDCIWETWVVDSRTVRGAEVTWASVRTPRGSRGKHQHRAHTGEQHRPQNSRCHGGLKTESLLNILFYISYGVTLINVFLDLTGLYVEDITHGVLFTMHQSAKINVPNHEMGNFQNEIQNIITCKVRGVRNDKANSDKGFVNKRTSYQRMMLIILSFGPVYKFMQLKIHNYTMGICFGMDNPTLLSIRSLIRNNCLFLTYLTILIFDVCQKARKSLNGNFLRLKNCCSKERNI